MKTDIYKIKTDQAWNRLYNRLDNDRLLAKVDEGRSIRKHSQWIRYGAVAAVLIGVVWGALYWMTGSEMIWQRKPPYYIRSILLLINGK